MLQPMRTKFRKAHKGRIKGTATSGATLSFGQFGLKAMEPDRVTRATGGCRFSERSHAQRVLRQTRRRLAFRRSGDYPERSVQSTQGGTRSACGVVSPLDRP